jgi:hydroxyacylglutathione hydrolase
MGKEDITTIELTFVNAFLIKVREGFVLIDTGLSMHWKRLEAKLISSGCLPDKLNLVIITHGDFDHSGNCAKLQEKYKCRIAMYKNDSPIVENGLFMKRKARTLQAKMLILIRLLFRRKFVLDGFRPDINLKEGQNLDEYGFNATVVHIPGHTKGSIGIITNDGNLFAGDIFINNRKPDIATYIENPDELKNSINILKNMNIKTVYPGHGKPFEFEQMLPGLNTL